MPFDSKSVNIISLYNEVAVSVYLYMSLLLSDFLDTQFPDNELVITNLRLIIAWTLTGILISTILINFLFAFFGIACSMLKFLKKKC